MKKQQEKIIQLLNDLNWIDRIYVLTNKGNLWEKKRKTIHTPGFAPNYPEDSWKKLKTPNFK